jgi:uncharacterized repeat protein (TIGR03847 family)
MSMKRPRHNMGRADWIGAEAIGLPGERTFRLLVSAGENSAQLWLEKEQLQALVDAIARMLAEIDMERGEAMRPMRETVPNLKPADFPVTPTIEMHVGALGMRYDAQRDIVALEAFDRDAPEDEMPVLRCLAAREQIEKLQQNGAEVLAGGRPRCPLCGTPLSTTGMPHFCPPTNGHQKLTADE